ncbi:MAG TPA: rhomboid family intramembrane serine protease [Solirubrobacteraceae bacterium]|nr:rhomboid family intramembrane serine protease [Solirubrobacteraceae bacterium]
MIPIKDNIPTDRFAVVTATLILINVVVYLISISSGGSIWSGPAPDVVVHYGAIPFRFTHWGRDCGLIPDQFGTAVTIGCQGLNGVPAHFHHFLLGPDAPTIETAFTAMFMHGSLLHIAGNMLFLWIFGNNVEDSMGRVRFIIFYLLGGLVALAGQIAVQPNSTAPTVGASGAIAAVLGGYILLYPRARVLTLVFIIFFVTVVELPALVVLGIWFVIQALYGAADLTHPTGGGGGVAYFAHIGGFLFGLALIHVFAQRRKPMTPRYPVY